MSTRTRLLVWAAVLVVLIIAALSARFTNDVRSLLPANDPTFTRELDFFTEQGAARILALEAWPTNEKVSEAQVHAALEGILPLVADLGAHPLRSGTAAAMAAFANQVRDHLPELTTADTLASLPALMTVESLSERLAALKKRALDPQDTFIATVASRDLLALSATPVQMLAFGPEGTQQQGLITVHPDGKHAILTLEVDFDPATLNRTNPLMAVIDKYCAEVAANGIAIETIGGYRHFRDNIRTVKHDLFASLPLCTVLIAVLLFSLLRSFPATAALHAPAIFGMLGALAAVVIADRELPMPMLGFAACVLGVAVDYATHRLVALRAGEDVTRPLVFSYITTASAFAVLLTSSVPAMQCIGLLVVGGLTMSLLSTLWLLPILAPKSFHRGAPDPWAPLSSRVLNLSQRFPRIGLLKAVIISACLFPGLTRLEVVQDLRRLDGSDPGAWEALDAFMTRWGKLESSDYLVQPSATLDDALERLVQSQRALGLPPTMVDVLLPSRAEQQRRRTAWNEFWQTHAEHFARNLEAACAAQNFRFKGFQPCLDAYRPVDSASRTDVTFASWKDTPVASRLGSFVQQTADGWRVAAPLPNKDDPLLHRLSINNPEIRGYAERAEQLDTGAWVAIRSHIGTYLVDTVQGDLRERGLFIGLTLLIVVSILLRRVDRVLGVILPPAIALGWTFGIMGWMGVELTPFSALGAAFVGGIGIDSAIFLSHPERRATALSPILAAAFTTIAGVSTLLLADHPMIFSIGQTLVIGMACSVVACLLITPGIVRR